MAAKECTLLYLLFFIVFLAAGKSTVKYTRLSFNMYMLLQVSSQALNITTRQRSGEGNVISCVCLSVHGGGGVL